MTVERSLLVALVAVLGILIAGYVILADRGRDVASYATFLGGPLVTAVVGYVLAQRTSAIQTTVQQVKHQTDGLLSARLDSVDTQLHAAAVDRADIAATGAEPQTPNGGTQ
jgi:hypothetical protein